MAFNFRKNGGLRAFWKRKWKEILAIVIGIFLLVTGAVVIWLGTLEMPNLQSFETRKVTQSTKIYDRTGTVLLYDVHKDVRRTIVPSDAISRNIKNAVVAIEDAEFYQHYGIRPFAILRSFLVDVFSLNFTQGGSTITQQVVKNSLLTNERTITRKLKEVVLALRLERILDKDSILSIYLNESPFGGTIYGVEEASETFFGKSASNVDIAESAYIASLLKAPTYFSPYGTNRDKLEDRKNLVLKRMLDNKFISQAEYDSALKEQVTFLPQQSRGIRAPHFVDFIIQQLQQKYGDRVLSEGGFKVITTLDYDLQAKAEEIVKKFALSNEQQFKASNAALVAIDPTNGQVLTMVGSRDYFDPAIDGNFNVATAYRQPGSSFKPIVYATAFNKGYQPETALFDVQTEFSTTCRPDGTPINSDSVCYRPQNYDGKFRGPVTMRQALANSLNIPSIKTLYLAGVKDSLHTAKDMGITSLNGADQYGLTLVLGGGEVSPLELTSAYGVFATEGIRNPYQSILSIQDNTGKMLEQFQTSPTQVLSQQTTRKITSILSDDDARTPLYGRHSLLYFADRDVAAKTGTTNDYRDVWIEGYTPNLVVGAWAGNNDNSPMEHKLSGQIVAPFWRAFMDEALKKTPRMSFNTPEPEDLSSLKPVLRGFWQGGSTYFIDKISGGLATDSTPPETRAEIAIPNVHSILYWVDKSDPLGAPPANPNDDPQFSHWEYGVQKWVAEHGAPQGGIPPAGSDTIHGSDSAPTISFITPTQGISYAASERMMITITHSGKYPLTKVDYSWNGVYIGSSSNEPFSFSFVPKDTGHVQSDNELKATAYDSVFNKSSTSVHVSISP